MKKRKPSRINSWAVLIVAAGQSTRLKAKVAKPFLFVDHRRTLLDLCLESFSKVPGLSYVVVATREHYMERAIQAIYRYKLTGIVTKGGEEREDSVREGLRVMPKGIKYVLVHDAARPLVNSEVIKRVLEATVQSGAVIPVVPVKDTLKVVVGNRIDKTLDRRHIRAVQTPQGFKLPLLQKAFQKLGKRASRLTDDAAVAEAAGYKVLTVDGDELNFKVTTAYDLERVKNVVWRNTESR